MKRQFFAIVVAIVVSLYTSKSDAAPPPSARTFDVGTMHVEQHGDKGSPVILIPGLASGAWAWSEQIPALAGTHRVYAVTLAGFDGRPAVEGDGMALALASLQKLIEKESMQQPVIVGHSLGGTLALEFATAHSESIGGVVSVDGLPVFPGTESIALAERPAMAERMRPVMTGASQAAFEAQQLTYMQRIGVVSPAKAGALATLTSRSDRVATADYAVRDLMLDLRPGLSAIRVPVLVISPYLAADFEARHITAAMKTEYYRSLLPGIARLEVLSIPDARHFVMIDQPDILNRALLHFIDTR